MKAFFRFWYDFIVGDDWVVAAGVVAVLGVAALLADSGRAGWVWACLGMTGLLILSVWRAARAHDRR
ncbi:MAG: hypothetical protein ACHQIG_07685 [Acidimicrobiia bacterium]